MSVRFHILTNAMHCVRVHRPRSVNTIQSLKHVVTVHDRVKTKRFIKKLRTTLSIDNFVE